MWEKFPEFFTQKSVGSFCTKSDEMNKNRNKTTHTQGLVAQVEWFPVANNGYSGVYDEGSKTVIMRLSETMNLYEGSKGHNPSVAFKFLIDGQESANILGMSSFRESTSWNFFENSMTNRVLTNDDLEEFDEVDEIMQSTLFKKLNEASSTPFSLGVSHIADKTNSGEYIEWD